MTGSGMGCPDWPKCFGSWIPPTHIHDLPDNYKEVYAERGYDKLDFNAFNTWTEYINRLLGLISGLFCAVLLLTSFFVKNRRLIFLSSFLVALMVFQGWMGAVVVYSVLAPFKISIHMLIALLIVTVLLYLNRYTVTFKYSNNHLNLFLVWLALTISIIQIVIGTQVRENVDVLLLSTDRDSLVSTLPSIFEYHRIVAWLVCLSNFILLAYYRKCVSIFYEIRIIIITIILLLLSGVVMTYYSLIGFFQFSHLILAVSLFISQMSILMKTLHLPTLKSP